MKWRAGLATLLVLALAACNTPVLVDSSLQKPKNFVAKATDPTTVRLTWDEILDATAYLLERKTKDGAFEPVGSFQGPSATDTGLKPGTTYIYRVAAFYLNGRSEFVETTVTTPAAGRPAPTNFKAVATSATSVSLSWDEILEANAYALERRTGTGPFASIGGAQGPSATDSNLTPNTTYTYRVAAVYSQGQSAFVEATVTTPAASAPPQTPSNLSVVAAATDSLTVGFSAVGDATSYALERASEGGAFAQIATLEGPGSGFLRYADGGLSPDAVYRYRVQASNASGSSGFTLEQTGITLAANGVPGTPRVLNLTANKDSGGEPLVSVSWGRVTGATGYVLERRTGASAYAEVARTDAGLTSYIDTSVAANTAYGYRLTALNAKGSSAPLEKTVTAQP